MIKTEIILRITTSLNQDVFNLNNFKLDTELSKIEEIIHKKTVQFFKENANTIYDLLVFYYITENNDFYNLVSYDDYDLIVSGGYFDDIFNVKIETDDSKPALRQEINLDTIFNKLKSKQQNRAHTDYNLIEVVKE